MATRMSTDHTEKTDADGGDPVTLPPKACFVTTRWTVVLTAGRNDTPRAQEALSRLCETYWYPLYAYARRRGHSPEDAQDLTQEFFARLLEHNWVGDADRAKGRFRTFLLTAMSRFLANEWNRARAQKRGGGAAPLPLDTAVAESRYCADAGNSMAPDRLYDRQWAMTLLDQALTRLGAEHTQSGKAAEFGFLSRFLTAERGSIPYETVATQLGLSETAARQAVHRLRKRFREVFRDEIAQTVAAPEEVEEEIRHLLSALAG
jgi:RNA polymerase sigma factor (sigma-70 family)